MELEITFREITPDDLDQVVDLITASAYKEYGERARMTLEKHYTRLAHNDDDGRLYWVATKEDTIVGICGLHHYEWGPQDVVWSGWFHVHPHFQRQGIGTKMMQHVCTTAQKIGYRRMFIEVYEDEEFTNGRDFYERFGFRSVATIPDYNREGVGAVVFSKKLKE